MHKIQVLQQSAREGGKIGKGKGRRKRRRRRDGGSGVVGRKTGKDFESRRRSETKAGGTLIPTQFKVEEIFVALLFFFFLPSHDSHIMSQDIYVYERVWD